MTLPELNDRVIRAGETGRITRLSFRQTRNFWARMPGQDHDVLFSLRRDGYWREVGQPANSPGAKLAPMLINR